MAKIKELTNMLLGEIAPHVDEMLAQMFYEIDSNENLSFKEKQEAKRQGMSALTKGLIGGAGVIGTGILARKPIGKAMVGAAGKMAQEGKTGKLQQGLLEYGQKIHGMPK